MFDDDSPRRRRSAISPDLTPMVDVTFLLLIFFMVATSFASVNQIPSPRLDSGDGAYIGPAPSGYTDVRIEVLHNNQIIVEDKPVSTLEETILAIEEGMARNAVRSIIVKLHPDSLHDRAIQVFDAAHALKITDIKQCLDDEL